MPEIEIRDAIPADVSLLATAFADWPKPASVFERYLADAASGSRDFVTVWLDGSVAGFVVIDWRSSYPPFAQAGTPEVIDLNVLDAHRGLGAASALMDEVEARIARRASTVGIRVGLYQDYGTAQRMYVRRGYVPDGAGLTIDGVVPVPGSSIVLDDDPVLALTKPATRAVP